MQRDSEFLATEKPSKLLLKLALPAVTAQLVNMLYNIVDRMYIGRLEGIGTEALAGVGACMPVILLVSAFAALASMGGAPRASIFMGQGDQESAERTMGNCMTLLLFLAALLTAALVINGAAALSVSLLQRREAHPHALLSGVVSLGAGLVVAFFPGLLMKSVTLAVGLWSLLVCAAQLGYVAQLAVMGERGKIKFALLAVLSLAAGVSLLWGYSAGRALQWLAGVYLLLYALWQLMDLVGVLINRNVESSRLLSRLRVHPPVLLTALLPSVVLKRLSVQYATLTQDVVTPKPSPARESWPETLEVVFHLGKNVAFGFGHVVVSLRGVTYSYGCYDESSNRLFGALSDGVILVCPTEGYIPFCQRIEKKLLIGFTLGLSTEAADALENGMRARLQNDCEPWTPQDRPEYGFDARFYKVRRGVFRLYNVMRTNCCAMAQIIAAGTGLNLLPPNGFVTPGAYFEYLESELRDPESNVLEMRIYAHR